MADFVGPVNRPLAMADSAAAAAAPMWGHVTATIDWCERNYATCAYIAEFWNTITNSVMIGLALFGMLTAYRAGVEGRFHLSYAALVLVGIGSWCFHGSLQYEMQLLDELPMVYSSAIFIYCITLQDPKRRHSLPLAAALTALSAVITVIYLWVQNPMFHEVSYGLMVLYLTIMCSITAYRFRHEGRPMRIIGKAIGLFLVAWALWNVDIHYCDQLHALRDRMGPFAPLLELHAWWHVLTGYSSYLQVVFSAFVQRRVCGLPVELRSMGPFDFMPYLVDPTREHARQTVDKPPPTSSHSGSLRTALQAEVQRRTLKSSLGLTRRLSHGAA